MISKIAVFGSTGMTGLCVVDAALERGLSVKALVRDPARIPEEYEGKIEAIVGDALVEEDVSRCVEGADAVVVALGTRNDLKPTTALSESIENIAKAMKKHNVRVASVCLSAFLFYETDKVPKMFVDLNADHQRMYDALKRSDLDYVAVFPPHIADTPLGEFTVEIGKSPGRVISKRELGKFLVDSVFESKYYGKVVGLCSRT